MVHKISLFSFKYMYSIMLFVLRVDNGDFDVHLGERFIGNVG